MYLISLSEDICVWCRLEGGDYTCFNTARFLKASSVSPCRSDTGGGGTQDVIRCGVAGVNNYVCQPFEIRIFLRYVVSVQEVGPTQEKPVT